MLLATSLQKTPYAALSRPVAGTIGNTLVTTLPGSVKAVNENMEALLKVVDHAIELIRGGSGEQVHTELSGPQSSPSSSASVHVHHHHHHDYSHDVPRPRTTALSHDPSAPGTPSACQIWFSLTLGTSIRETSRFAIPSYIPGRCACLCNGRSPATEPARRVGTFHRVSQVCIS